MHHISALLWYALKVYLKVYDGTKAQMMQPFALSLCDFSRCVPQNPLKVPKGPPESPETHFEPLQS